MGLYLKRNHISYGKHKIKEFCEKKGLELPEIYYKDTPVKMDMNYMAKADEIREQAQKHLLECENSKALGKIKEIAPRVIDEDKRSGAESIAFHTERLRSAIDKDDLVTLRRLVSHVDVFGRADRFLEDFDEEGQDQREVVPLEQLSLFE